MKVCLRLDSRVTQIDLSKESVITADGAAFRADLIVGADGENSVCRSKILGRTDRPRPTGSLVYRFTVNPECIRRDPKLHHLVNPPAITSWLGPRAHIVLYEIRHNHMVNVVLTCPDPIEDRSHFGSQEADAAELESLFNDWDPVCMRLFRLADNVRYWSLLQPAQENRLWTDCETQRLILIGDAAHSMTPFLYVQNISILFSVTNGK